jgi:hypothetical protein
VARKGSDAAQGREPAVSCTADKNTDDCVTTLWTIRIYRQPEQQGYTAMTRLTLYGSSKSDVEMPEDVKL